MARTPLQNDDPRLDPGQADYDEKFNQQAKATELEDLENNFNAPSGDPTTENDNIEKARQAEEAGSGDYVNNFRGNSAKKTSNASEKGAGKFTLKSIGKKRGGIIGLVIAAILGIGAAGTFFSAPGFIFQEIFSTLDSFSNHSGPIGAIRTIQRLSKMFTQPKDKYSGSTCNVECQDGTASETLVDDLTAQGFQVESGGEVAGREVIHSITFPDGTHITTPSQFTEAIAGNPAEASDLAKAYNTQDAFELSSKAGESLDDKFGIDKFAKVAGETEEDVVASERKALGLEGETAELDPTALKEGDTNPADEEASLAGNSHNTPVLNEVEGATGEAEDVSKDSNPVAGACLAYDIGNGIVYADKLARIGAMAAMAWTFYTAWGQAKAGDSTGAVIPTLASQLTTPDSSGQTATSSLGYRTAATQDTAPLSTTDSMYSAAPTGGLMLLIVTITGFVSAFGPVGLAAVHETCKVETNPIVAIGETCAEEGVQALATAVETEGTGAIEAAIQCGVRTAVLMGAISIAIGQVLDKVVPKLVEGDLPVIGETLVGSGLGDALFTGMAETDGGIDASYGLSPATSPAQVEQFALDTATVTQQENDIARYDARNTPFDITNQYSFLGTLAQNIGLSSFIGSSFSTNLSQVAALIPNSFASLTDNVSAISNITTAQKLASVYGKCSDPGLSGIGVTADAFCNPTFVMSNAEINADENTTIAYMTTNHYIDEATGDPIWQPTPGSNSPMLDDTSGDTTADDLNAPDGYTYTPYQLWLVYCSNRSAPWGESAGTIEDDNYSWESGQACVQTTSVSSDPTSELFNFSVYTMDKGISDSLSNPYDGNTVGQSS